MLQITFLELEVVTQALLTNPGLPPSNDFTVLPIVEKMSRNSLNDSTLRYMNMGMVQAAQVESYVEKTAILNPQFPEQLKAGFLVEYNNFRQESGLNGDELFAALWRFACQGSNDFDRQSAALATLTYLFHKCEIFEK